MDDTNPTVSSTVVPLERRGAVDIAEHEIYVPAAAADGGGDFRGGELVGAEAGAGVGEGVAAITRDI